ncbi:hypothetical protein N7509_005539 [Penicillium cosmopolitanum]|uniref:Uncharacterized protein n=1 Tax=Penicillium cosmopolitanum TaxID=1131564 RepID=A0A9X0BA47_9EURO|nr:uncharacterized protein N7509_005539 [Penicillium cosmopolitanum]KAJ5397426.1 hypothetical protein N7509_005539 [Penicillium cosmopolitanum]
MAANGDRQGSTEWISSFLHTRVVSWPDFPVLAPVFGSVACRDQASVSRFCRTQGVIPAVP